VHIPFCRHRCAYCDFNTYARQEQQIPAYVTALGQEATHVGAQAPDHLILHTIFFGGGTPSLLSPAQIGAIVQSIYHAFAVTAEAEITLEANPGTVSFGGLQSLRQSGINRLSLGVQSANGRVTARTAASHREV
jgi:oxygen-independent coproporphyrinogen-3 oxidase